MSDEKIEKLAVLIDADNAQPSIVEGLLSEIAKYGTANVKRIYGDWTLPGLKGWKEFLLQYSIQPIQQFGYTSGKNATDSALIIDAMDLLYTGKFDGFCIVSSDSDFTKLASRIREAGLLVYGFGERKTPKAFVSACDKFIFTEVLRSKDDNSDKISRRPASELKKDTKLVNLLRNSVEASSDDSGWAHLACQHPRRRGGDPIPLREGGPSAVPSYQQVDAGGGEDPRPPRDRRILRPHRRIRRRLQPQTKPRDDSPHPRCHGSGAP